MNKLIKLSDNHYVVVDDSDIGLGDIVIEKLLTDKYEIFEVHTPNDVDKSRQKKIIYSTRPLENINFVDEAESRIIPKFKLLLLSEVEKAIYGHDYHELAIEYCNKHNTNDFMSYILFIEGFRVHKEITKDKLFTEQDLRSAISFAWNYGQRHENNLTDCSDFIIKSLLPKTEWNVKVTTEGKIILL